MQSYELILGIAEKGYSLYEARELKLIIDEIWGTLKDIYTDIAKGHFAAAQSSFAAARKSRAPKQEIRNGNSQLMAAYNIYIPLLSKTRTERFLLFFHEEVPVVDEEEQTKIKACLFEIATLIALNYADLKEPENAKVWKDEAIKYLNDHADFKTAYLTGEYVYSHINKKYVEVEQTEVYDGGSISGGHIQWRTVTHYYLNRRGQYYVEQQKNEIRQKDMDIFKSKKIR